MDGYTAAALLQYGSAVIAGLLGTGIAILDGEWAYALVCVGLAELGGEGLYRLYKRSHG